MKSFGVEQMNVSLAPKWHMNVETKKRRKEENKKPEETKRIKLKMQNGEESKLRKNEMCK